MPKPNFFIVGAPKSGTTALSEYLREHPNVFMCTPKEPHYFSSDLPKYRIVNTEEKYLGLFDDAAPVHLAIGEASVWYLYSKEAIKNIKDFNADSKIIVMLRNPVDLVYSMHAQHLYSMDEDEVDFKAAWEMNDQRKKGFKIPKNCRDEKVIFYDEIAKFGEQVDRLIAIFPRDQIKIIFSEDFFDNTCFIYKEVLEFLKLPDDHRHDFPVINQNKHHKLRWLGALTERPPKNMIEISLKIKKAIGLKKLNILSALRKTNVVETPRQQLPNDLKNKLIKKYNDDIIFLSHLTGRNLDHWVDQL